MTLSRIIRCALIACTAIVIGQYTVTFPENVRISDSSQATWEIIGTTLQEFQYDGLSRMTRSFDNNEPEDAKDDATVAYAYDSLGRQLEEVQNGQAVSSRWMGDNNRIGLVYPNGRELEYTFDKRDRIDTIKDKGATKNIADYNYIGPGRVLERTYQNGVQLTYLDGARQKDVGYDGLKRVVLHRHLRQDNSLVAGFAYDYDRANNKLFEIKQHENNRRENYSYDSIYRLGRFARQGEPDDTWQLDGVGNWANRQGVANTVNSLNEYTSFSGTPQVDDDNGNLINDGTNRYQYDFANRLRKVIRKSDNAVIAVYRYDAHDRRNERIVINTASFNDQVRYLYDDWREIEEQRATATQQYVYGGWIDELLTLDKDTNHHRAIDQTFFYLQDAKTYVTALTDFASGVVERVTYDAYGKPSSEQSKLQNLYLFAGRRLDPETSFYYYRHRYYAATLGRFIQRDKGIWYDISNMGGAYTYVRNNPVNKTDPSGLQGEGTGYEEELKKVKQAIRDLGDDDLETREKAEKELTEKAQKFYGILKQAKRSNLDPEVQDRLSRILRNAPEVIRQLEWRKYGKDLENYYKKLERAYDDYLHCLTIHNTNLKLEDLEDVLDLQKFGQYMMREEPPSQPWVDYPTEESPEIPRPPWIPQDFKGAK
ncbi:hypothetical protein HYR54_04045 [Candidatus Acetothermia bacterium]|nr:hypothetical protein [Candidatus Acetothermia bacterium]